MHAPHRLRLSTGRLQHIRSTLPCRAANNQTVSQFGQLAHTPLQIQRVSTEATAGAAAIGAGYVSKMGRSAPPPPSSGPAFLLSSSASSSSSPSNTAKISSQRTAQIARHLSSSSRASSKMASPVYTTRKIAAPHTLEHRIYIEKDGQPISAFHDIPLYANQEQTILNMVVEIPRWTNAKQEVSLSCFPPHLSCSKILTKAVELNYGAIAWRSSWGHYLCPTPLGRRVNDTD